MLSNTIMSPSSGMFPIESSTLYQRWLLEQEQIARLKWIESEKSGYDIGHHRAYWLWATTYRKGWFDAMRASGMPGF